MNKPWGVENEQHRFVTTAGQQVMREQMRCPSCGEWTNSVGVSYGQETPESPMVQRLFVARYCGRCGGGL